MMDRVRLRAMTLVSVLLMMSAAPLITSAQSVVSCCNSTDFKLYLMGESDDGTLTPFQEDLEGDSSDSESTFATTSFAPAIVGTWGVVWGIEGDYNESVWDFSIPYEVEDAVGVTLNSTLKVKIGGSFYQGEAGFGEVNPLTGSGLMQVSVEIGSGVVNDGNLVQLELSVSGVFVSQPGEEAGIRFLWGSQTHDAHISMRFPLVDVEMKDASVLGNLVYFPIVLKSGFNDRMWSGSTGGISVQGSQISQMPIATGVDGGVEVTFFWEVPDDFQSGTVNVDFQLTPQDGLQITQSKSHEIVIGNDDGEIGGWYPANEPLRTGGSTIDLEINAEWDGYEVQREAIIQFDGSMSQWMRWGLDNIGNQSLGSNSWWNELDSYANDIPSADRNNGRVDDSELLALQGHLYSASNLRKFMSNGLFLEVESILGVDPIKLGPTEITIDMGPTRAFSADSITIVIDTSYTYDSSEGARQILVETFVRPSQDDYWTEIALSAELKATLFEDLGAVASQEIQYKHRRWVVLEVITVEESELDPDLDFRIEYQPSGFILYGVLIGAAMSVLFLSIGIGFAMTLTKRRTSLPSLVTVITLGCLALVIYALGMPMPIVFGVSLSSVFLVFPVALVSPKDETVQKMTNKPRGPSIQCPVCSTKVAVESDVRPLRMECPSCENMLRVEE